MPGNVYSEINLHLTWHTKHDAPVLVDTVESRSHHYLRHRALQTPGIIVHEIGGTVDHIHLVVSIPPTVTISDWIGKLKGASSHYINHEICNRKVLSWQDGYGVVSFGTKDLPWVVSYVRNQKERVSPLKRAEITGEGKRILFCCGPRSPALEGAGLSTRLRRERPLKRPSLVDEPPFTFRED